MVDLPVYDVGYQGETSFVGEFRGVFLTYRSHCWVVVVSSVQFMREAIRVWVSIQVTVAVLLAADP